MLNHNDESQNDVTIHISQETKNINEDKQSINIPLDLTIEDEDEPLKVIWHTIPLGDPETVKIIEEKQNEPLTYISLCTEEKIKSLEQKYQMSRKLLDAVLKENLGKYYAFRVLNFASKAGNILFCYTLVNTSVLALNASYQATASTNATLSSAICYGITVPCGLLDLLLFNYLIYSSLEDSVESTLQYMLKGNVISEEMIRNQVAKSKSPLWYYLKNIGNKAVCLIFFSGGSIIRISAVENLLSSQSKAARLICEIPVALVGLYFAHRYFSKDYYESNLIEEIRSKNFLKNTDWHTRFQIFMEYLCFVGTFVYPQNYSLAIIGKEIFGWWLSPELVSIITGWQLTFTTVPKIVKGYTEDNDWVNQYLENKYRPLILDALENDELKEMQAITFQSIENEMGRDARESLEHIKKNDNLPRDKAVQDIVQIYRNKKLNPEILKNKSRFHLLWDHPANVMPLILEMGLGLYGGSQITRAIHVSPYIGALLPGIPLGCGLVYSKWKTMQIKAMNHTLRQTYAAKIPVEMTQEKTGRDKVLEGSIVVINAGSAAISALFLIGSLAYLLQNSSAEGKDIGMIFVLYAALKSAFYYIAYNSTKTSETAKILRERFFKKSAPVSQELKVMPEHIQLRNRSSIEQVD